MISPQPGNNRRAWPPLCGLAVLDGGWVDAAAPDDVDVDVEAVVLENAAAEDVEDGMVDVELGSGNGGKPVLAELVVKACSMA